MSINFSRLLLWVVGSQFALALATGCNRKTIAENWEYREMQRIKSPDSLVEAVIITGNGGGTTAMVTSVYLVPVGARVAPEERDKSVFDSDHLKGFSVAWKETKLLEIQYEEARILAFKNYWFAEEIQNYRYVVEFQLKHLGSGFALPEKVRIW